MTADMQLLGLVVLICILSGLPAAPYEGTMDAHVDLHGQGLPRAGPSRQTWVRRALWLMAHARSEPAVALAVVVWPWPWPSAHAVLPVSPSCGDPGPRESN